jgi:uncharacterized protein YndB with AHSA1/START domain
MSNEKITVRAIVAVEKQTVWDCYTRPEHITQWNFADPSWCCPSATNDLRVGGRYLARMEARDGSFGFDFDAIYSELREGERFTYIFGGREATVTFQDLAGATEVIVRFDPESENTPEIQRQGWQAILDNFKRYTEGR